MIPTRIMCSSHSQWDPYVIFIFNFFPNILPVKQSSKEGH
jgi:hypothetical protein